MYTNSGSVDSLRAQSQVQRLDSSNLGILFQCIPVSVCSGGAHKQLDNAQAEVMPRYRALVR